MTAASSILGYGCVTAAGQGASALFDALATGRDCSWVPDTSRWPAPPAMPPRICTIPDELTARFAQATATTAAGRMAALLEAAWDEAREMSLLTGASSPNRAVRLGIIFASTKGCIEDYVWDKTASVESALKADPFSPIVELFLARTRLRPDRCLTISNACTSAHVALELASHWTAADVVDQVLVLSGDLVGPFIVDGFASLKSLAQDRVTPFGAGRQGIQLGEAATAILVGRGASNVAPLRLRALDTRAEGYALTRSNEAGATLEASCRATTDGAVPDAVIAHATGTPANDAMEDQVYGRLFGMPDQEQEGVEITATKWCIGHTLGASGAVDLIAAAESLRRRTLFAIANTSTIDPRFVTPRERYLTRGMGGARPALNSILVASAGFGGMHGTALVER